MSAAYAKPLPAPDPETQPFWDGCRKGRLLIQRCGTCGRRRFPPTTYCPHCRSDAADWIEASGRGRVFSWIVVHHPVPADVYAAAVPYIVALVDLEEGVRMVANLEGIAPSAVTAELAVEVRFRPATDEIALPVFVPRGS